MKPYIAVEHSPGVFGVVDGPFNSVEDALDQPGKSSGYRIILQSPDNPSLHGPPVVIFRWSVNYWAEVQ